MTLVSPPVGLVQQLLELCRYLPHSLATLFHTTPGGSNAPALGARLGRLIDRFQLELTAVMQYDGEVDEPVEPRLPGCDAAFRVSGCVGDEVGGGETDGASEYGLVDCTGVAGHLSEDVEDEVSIVGRVILTLLERGV